MLDTHLYEADTCMRVLRRAATDDSIFVSVLLEGERQNLHSLLYSTRSKGEAVLSMLRKMHQ